jgi:hypothetical protein
LLFGMALNLSEVCVAWDVPQSFWNCKQRNLSCSQKIEELVCDLFHGVLEGMYPRWSTARCHGKAQKKTYS